MKSSRFINTLFAGLLVSGAVQAADIAVPSGTGTLAQAIADATAGDTLVLESGVYSNNGDITIDKSLTIRGLNSQSLATTISNRLVIDGTDIDVTLQALGFSANVKAVAAAEIKILESQFVVSSDMDISEYRSAEGDGNLTIVGNFFFSGSEITTIHSDDAYIAGNTFEGTGITSTAPVWIVGNSIKGVSNRDVININTPGYARILANRVYMSGTASGTHFLDGIDVTAGAALIAGNIVQVNHAGTRVIRRGISASSTTYARVFNNIVDAGAITRTVNYYSSYGILAYGEVSGNMLTNLVGGFRGIAGSGVENNLCYNNYNSTCGSNPISVDPEFVDRTDYRLTATSPAIDAGLADPFLADLDRTRNDIGAYGGPWSIEQYDAQRDPLYLGPFVYPLFEANSSFVDGKLQVRALGVARLR